MDKDQLIIQEQLEDQKRENLRL